MTEQDLKAELNKAIALFQEGKYKPSDLESHVLQIIKDNSEPALEHKKQLERWIFKVDELLRDMNQLLGGKKSKVVACKEKGAELEKKIKWFLANGYSIDRWKGKVGENSIF